MSAEMAEQPEVLAALVARREEIAETVASVLPGRDRSVPSFQGLCLVARGSSDNVAVHARYLLELATGRPVSMVAPSLHTLYDADVDYRGQLVLAVTNDKASSLASVAHAVVDLRAGSEQAVPATKTVTAQLVALILITCALGGDRRPFLPSSVDDLAGLPDEVAAVLADHGSVAAVAGRVTAAKVVATVGRGLTYAAALETALKIRESARMTSEGWSAADLRHGPIAALDPDSVVIGFAVPGPAESDTRTLLAGVLKEGVPIVLVGSDADADLPLPPTPEALAAVVGIVRGQQLALEVARRRGLDPDAPAGLSKVTPTT